jgi:hypothetical protein
MTGKRTAVAIRCLHWVVGLIILYESWRTFQGALAVAHGGIHPAHLTGVKLVLSGVEIIAALLFLIPRFTIAGAYSLLGIFALAVAIHALHGDFPGLEFLVLYAAAVYVALVHEKEGSQARTP